MKPKQRYFTAYNNKSQHNVFLYAHVNSGIEITNVSHMYHFVSYTVIYVCTVYIGEELGSNTVKRDNELAEGIVTSVMFTMSVLLEVYLWEVEPGYFNIVSPNVFLEQGKTQVVVQVVGVVETVHVPISR